MGKAYKLYNTQICAAIGAVFRARKLLPLKSRHAVYNTLFTAKINYLINICGNTTSKIINKIQRQQNKMIKIIHNFNKNMPTKEIYKTINVLKIKNKIILEQSTLIQKIKTNQN